MPRYVLLRHELPPDAGRASHWDFMLEHQGALWTWAFESLPADWQDQLGMSRQDARDEVTTRKLVDHRLAYLTYEGQISNGRGTVKRVAEGEYDLLSGEDSPIEIELRGTLTGKISLDQRVANSTEWVLTSSPLPDGIL